MSDNKTFGNLTFGINWHQRSRTVETSNHGLYFEASGNSIYNDELKFGTVDIALIPDMIEHLQKIYDAYPKKKKVRERLEELPSGTHFRDVRQTWTPEYVKLGNEFFRVKDAKPLPITNWSELYDFEVVK